jgi:hypothetical protein
MRFCMLHLCHAIKNKNCQIGAIFGSLEVQNEAFPTVPQRYLAGKTDKWKALKHCVKEFLDFEANVPNWAQRSQESILESGREVRDGM